MSGRRGAFDPSRLDDELDALLPPPPNGPPGAPVATATVQRPTPVLPVMPADVRATDAVGEQAKRAPRGAGGRPTARRSIAEETGATTAAVRIPKPLYDAVVHDLLGTLVERPSYAQIVGWTCEDHADDVVAELLHAAAAVRRAPRGRRLATDGVPLTLRFQPTERAALDDVIRRAEEEAEKITRTAAVTAALRAAVKHGVTAATS